MGWYLSSIQLINITYAIQVIIFLAQLISQLMYMYVSACTYMCTLWHCSHCRHCSFCQCCMLTFQHIALQTILQATILVESTSDFAHVHRSCVCIFIISNCSYLHYLAIFIFSHFCPLLCNSMYQRLNV